MFHRKRQDGGSGFKRKLYTKYIVNRNKVLPLIDIVLWIPRSIIVSCITENIQREHRGLLTISLGRRV